MRTRNHDYLNRHTFEREFGFQIFDEGEWKNVAEDGAPCIYKTEKERDEKRAQYRKLKPSNGRGKPTAECGSA